tara:strand:- start:1253 stop:1507 length:255 start_codon:yes stop_codon:yes gene_type:complete
MLKISPQLLPARKTFRPTPITPYFRHGKFIIRNMRIDPGARVTVPMPDSTQCVTRVIEPNIEALLPESIQLITAAETAANYQDI